MQGNADDTMIFKRRLLEKIDHLGSTEHMEILRIINEHNVPLTENNNGVFFNMTTLDPKVYTIIEDFVNYCYENKRELDKYDQKLHECKFFNKSTFAMQYSVNEPRDKKDTALNLMDVVERTGTTDKMNEFIAKLCSSNEKVTSKRNSGRFMLCKKKFMKRSVAQETDGTQDVLQPDHDFSFDEH